MSISFSQLLQRAKRERGYVELDVPSDWMQGRSVFGGLQVVVALEAMRTCVPSTPLRTLQATFVAPVPEGIVGARAHVLREGKSATHVEARLVDGSETLAVVIGVFGHPRSSKATRLPRQPDVDADQPLDLIYMPGIFPSFTQHFGARWLRGSLPFSGQPSHEQVIEVAMKDEGPVTEGHVVAIADFIPPVALSYLDARAPGSTLTWMLEFLCDAVDRQPLAGWRVDAELIAARDGYTNQAVTVWAPDGTPVALSRQSMLVFG
jgi:acyl-coenzyme A thioesterase PaaI-like protein